MEVDDFHNDYEYENMDDTVHKNNRFDAETIDHDNLQQQIQHPDKEKATGAPKKVRSHTQKAEIWKMVSNERILVMFNKFGKPVGDIGKELVKYSGTLVRMPEHVSIEHSDRRKVPMQQGGYHGGKWRTWKGVLKPRGYDPSLTIDEIVAQQINNDDRVNPTQFKELVKHWFTPEFQNTCAKKRSSRSNMKEPHVTGTKSSARLPHEVVMKNDGVYSTRGEMYIKTRTRKDGSVVDDEAASVVASLKDQDDFTRDDYSKVKGPEKRGYVRLVGRMPATKDKGDSEINSQTIHQLQSVVNVMMNIIHEHIPNANLSTVLKDMNIHVTVIVMSSRKRKSERIAIKSLSRFTNTEEDPIDLDTTDQSKQLRKKNMKQKDDSDDFVEKDIDNEESDRKKRCRYFENGKAKDKAENGQRKKKVVRQTRKKVDVTEASGSKRWMILNTRSSPAQLFRCVKLLRDNQKRGVMKMDFGKLLKFNMDGIPSKMTHFVVDRLKCKRMEIICKGGCLKITPQLIHKLLGLPIGGVKIR
ncbi:hypothetical protein R6Q57_005678 [Mikania cordata]